MYGGFSGSTGAYHEALVVKTWEFVSSGLSNPATPQPSPPPELSSGLNNPATNARPSSGAMITGVCAGAVVAAFVVAGLLYLGLIKRRKKATTFKSFKLFNSLEASDTSRVFTIRELSKATKFFSTTELLSSGAFGDVYRGTLPSGALVAVKRIKEYKEQGEEDFLAEATTPRQIRNRILLQLRGWSSTPGRLFLTCDFMCNGSLDKWLHQSSPNPNPNPGDESDVKALSWSVRHYILAGIASRLE